MEWFFRPKVQLGLFVNLIFVIFTIVSPIFGEHSRSLYVARAVESYSRPISVIETNSRPVSYVYLPPRKFPPQATFAFGPPNGGEVSVYPKEDLTLLDKSGRRLTLSPVFATVRGRAPRQVLLRIYSYTTSRPATLPDEVEVEVKAERGNFWAVANVAHDTTSVGDTKVEGMGVNVPYATFVGIVSSEHVTVRVGQDEVTLTARQLEALRDMQRCIQDDSCS
jgi:hypothetical protein